MYNRIHHIMDAKVHDKIVEYLLQYRKVIPNTDQLSNKFAIGENYALRNRVDDLIRQIDRYAVMDDKGWIK